MAYTKNMLGNRKVYSRHYGDFRGVDFSSDHTQVHEQRLAYLVNMYKDYQSGQGKALETVAGFRRRVVLPEEAVVFGIHQFDCKGNNGDTETKILFHAGTRLYLWHNYPNSVNVVMREVITLPEGSETTQGGLCTFLIKMHDNVSDVKMLVKPDGEDITPNINSYDTETHILSVSRSDLSAGDTLYVSYVEGEIVSEDSLFSDMNTAKSVSFVFNNRLYIVDGKNYLVYDGVTVYQVRDNAYIPTTYINIIPSGENADIGVEYEQRNILQPKFKHTFIADGTTTDFYMNENALEAVCEVKIYGNVLAASEYTVDLENGKITLSEAPQKPEDVTSGAYPEFYAGVEITAQKTFTSVSGVTEEKENIYELITDCSIVATFDNRVFVSGNPNYPNHIFYCGRNITGYVDPSYFGILNYMQDGVSTVPITGMIPVADTLMVLKGDTRQDGSTYFHTATETGQNLHPKIYPAQQGLCGIGCLGACINFLDDPIFISRLGVEAIGQLSVRYERAVEHRSSLIDAKLVNMDLSKAVVEEWNGYLLVLVDGKIFMADSRQKYANEIGVPQYEWYYLEDIGIWKNQYPEYRYSSQIYSELEGKTVRYCPVCKKSEKYCECENDSNIIEIPLRLAKSVYNYDKNETVNLTGEVVNPPDENGEETAGVFDERMDLLVDGITYEIGFYYTIHEKYNEMGEFEAYEAFLCERKGNFTGGTFKPATVIKSMENNLLFGTENGIICSFNFDKRDEQGEIAPQYYSFDERTIFCGCATKMDCCGIPHLNKNTVKKSTVVKTKSFISSAAKMKVRTNKKPYQQIARINSTLFNFDNTDFSDFSFLTTDQSLFAVKEKEKKWVEKQYYVYSDEYMKPFALFYISFRYNISGRYKE